MGKADLRVHRADSGVCQQRPFMLNGSHGQGLLVDSDTSPHVGPVRYADTVLMFLTWWTEGDSF